MIAKLTLIVVLASAVGLQLSSSEQQAVTRYQAAIRAAQGGSRRGAVEAAFGALEPVSQALMAARGNQRVLEALSDDDFDRLRRELPGLIVNREEIVFVKADPDYFNRLAAAHGDAADREFFSRLKATYNDLIWPVYVEQQTDYSGCTRFGSGKLVDSYTAWTSFRRKYPTRYVTAVQNEIDEIGQHLTQSTCACGDLASVEEELQRFLKTFPNSPFTTGINTRLSALRARQSNIRSSCISG